MTHDRELHAARRREFMRQMEGGVAIFRAAPAAIRSYDVEYPYRQDNDLLYLTGFPEPETTCLLAPGSAHPYTLFVRPRDREREVWTGLRAGIEGAASIYGADAAHPVEELIERLPKLVEHAPVLYFAPGRDTAFNQRVLDLFSRALDNHARSGAGPRGILDPGTILHEMRLFKGPDEIVSMDRAAAISGEAHGRAMRETRAGQFEYEIEALVDYEIRRRGATGSAYPSIVASGRNATVLHYIENTRQMQEGDLLLLDAGAEVEGYCADLTRTYPVGRRFSDRQRELYEVVLHAQEEAIAAVRPGAAFDAPHQRAVELLVDGLMTLGLLKGSRDEVIEQGRYRRFFMHRTSHWLGMDVHDVGVYNAGEGPRPLGPGMVLTIEPGLYVGADDDVDPKWRGIGIRIEDDVLVTDDGARVLTADTPKSLDDIEAIRNA